MFMMMMNLFVLCTKYHDVSAEIGAALLYEKYTFSRKFGRKGPLGRSRQRWDHNIKLGRDEFMPLGICETTTVMC